MYVEVPSGPYYHGGDRHRRTPIGPSCIPCTTITQLSKDPTGEQIAEKLFVYGIWIPNTEYLQPCRCPLRGLAGFNQRSALRHFPCVATSSCSSLNSGCLACTHYSILRCSLPRPRRMRATARSCQGSFHHSFNSFIRSFPLFAAA